MRNINLFFGIIVCICFSCNSGGDNFTSNGLNEANADYLSKKGEFGKDLTDHFPNKIKNLPIEINYKNDSFGLLSYFYLFEFNLEKHVLDSIKSFANENKLKLLNYKIENDSIINTNQLNSFLRAGMLQKKKLIIIPYFENVFPDHKEDLFKNVELFNIDNKNGLSNEFITYIIDSEFKKEGRTSNNNATKLNDSDYSKGITMNDKNRIAIFWTIKW